MAERKTNKLDSFFKRVSEIASIIGDSICKFIKRFDIEIFLVAITIIALLIRVAMFNEVSWDVESFLTSWYKEILNDYKALGKSVGDYTPAYLYFIWFLSLFRFEPGSLPFVYGIKIFSIIFDFACAIFAGLIVYRLTDKNKLKAAFTYALVLCGITVCLNSSWWGQCDSIFVSFCIASIYFFLRKNHRTSMILYGFAFAFKLQSIFILPIFVIAAFRRELKFKYFLYIPFVYILFALPSCFIADNFFDRFGEIMMVYVNQTANSYSQLALNAGTFWTLIFKNFTNSDTISAFSVPLSLGVIGTTLFALFHSKKEFDDFDYIDIFMLFSLIVPFILPHMHDRYYFLTDVMVCIYVILKPKMFYVAILEIANSLFGYLAYLWNVSFITISSDTSINRDMTFRFGAILALIAIIVISVDLFKRLYPKQDNLIKESE
ncbi:MAG: hypothetical protein PUA56_03590 [Bacillales bacterium]|nr:hypothetical protein [Bacillales bacterium]